MSILTLAVTKLDLSYLGNAATFAGAWALTVGALLRVPSASPIPHAKVVTIELYGWTLGAAGGVFYLALAAVALPAQAALLNSDTNPVSFTSTTIVLGALAGLGARRHPLMSMMPPAEAIRIFGAMGVIFGTAGWALFAR